MRGCSRPPRRNKRIKKELLPRDEVQPAIPRVITAPGVLVPQEESVEPGQELPPLDSPAGTALPAQAKADTALSWARPHMAASFPGEAAHQKCPGLTAPTVLNRSSSFRPSLERWNRRGFQLSPTDFIFCCLAKGSDTEISLQRQQQCERDAEHDPITCLSWLTVGRCSGETVQLHLLASCYSKHARNLLTIRQCYFQLCKTLSL